MNKGKFLNKLAKLTDLLIKIIQINFMFIIFSILGLVIFGIGPAYYASNVVLNKYKNKENPKLFETYMEVFKKHIWHTTFVTIIYLVIVLLLGFNIYSYITDFKVGFVQSFGLLANIFIYLLATTTYMTYPTMKEEFDLSVKDALIYSFKLPWSIPLHLILTYLFLIIPIVGIVIMPQIFFFVFFGLFIFFGNNLSYKLYEKIEGVSEDGELDE